MKNRNKLNNTEKSAKTTVFIFGMAIAIVTSILVSLFLSGKIIEIPKGTHEGGVISAIGVSAILVFMVIISLIVNKVIASKQNKKL